ncbi:hypothetical protein DFJ73DRAFT_797406 [Zopfochytrium polystomum]|nr:hypothetical protein DFJ73DRAFT_797406 [Zopfochytrium polystomum]
MLRVATRSRSLCAAAAAAPAAAPAPPPSFFRTSPFTVRNHSRNNSSNSSSSSHHHRIARSSPLSSSYSSTLTASSSSQSSFSTSASASSSSSSSFVRISPSPPHNHPLTASAATTPAAVRFAPTTTTTAAATSSSPAAGDAAVIGWVAAVDAPARDDDVAHVKLLPGSFAVNPKFEGAQDFYLLHDVIKHHAHQDEGLQAMAAYQKEGFLHVNDGRVFSTWGRVNDPEDIFGSVLVKDGKIVEGSYQRRMPTHRLVSMNGLSQLSDFLHGKLLQRLGVQQ